MKKQNLIVILVIAVLAVTIIYGLYRFISESSVPQPVLTLDKVDDSDWYKGNKNAKNILIEYSDFQCPACRAYSPLVMQFIQEMGPDTVFVYRHFPLSQHPNSDIAARAAEAAGNQGKFWEMHERLFLNQPDWSGEATPMTTFVKYAQELGLDTEKFKSDAESSAVKAKVKNQLKSGTNFKVNSTPSFFVNGKKINNPKTYDELKALLTGGAVTAGTQPAATSGSQPVSK